LIHIGLAGTHVMQFQPYVYCTRFNNELCI